MELLIKGDVQEVIAGNLTEQSLEQVDASTMPYALGGGGGMKRGQLLIGETIIYDGKGYVFTPQGSWRKEKQLQVAFLMGIAKKPAKPLHINEHISIENLYERILKTYAKGFVVIGEVHFHSLHAAYLKRSPIYGEDINVHQNKYWTSEKLSHTTASLFGVCMKEADPRIFYNNPNEKSAPTLLSHSHILMNEEARHLLTHSLLTSAHLYIEAID